MLNEIRNSHLGARCTAFSVTTASSTATASLGQDDLSSATSGATGKSTLNLKKPYARLPITVATPGANVANGGFATYDTDATKSAIVLESLGVAGSGDDGTIHGLSFGWDYAQSDHLGFHGGQPLVNTNGYEPILLGVHVTAAGAVTMGGKLITPTISDTSLFTCALRHAFCRTAFAVASPIHASAAKAISVLSSSASSVGIQTFQSGGTKEANEFQALILGWRHKDVLWGRRSIVQTPRRKPKIIAFEITDTAGTPSVTIGSDDLTVTDNGTGDYTLTWKTASKPTQAPIVIVTGKTTRTQLHSAPTATSARILSFNAGGSATDGSLQGVALCFDYADEYAIFG